MEVGHGGSRSCATLESHRDRDAGRPGRAQDDPGRDTERGRARARPWNTFCGEEARKGCQRGSGGWARRGLANGLGGNFQPAEGLRVRCRKEGVTLETGPPRDVAVLTPSTCEWTLFGSRVFADDRSQGPGLSDGRWVPFPEVDSAEDRALSADADWEALKGRSGRWRAAQPALGLGASWVSSSVGQMSFLGFP